MKAVSSMFQQFTLGIEEEFHIVDPHTRELRSVSEILAEGKTLVVDDLGSRRDIEHIYTILDRGTSADEQLRVWRETSDVKAVVDHLIEMTMQNVPCEVIPVALAAAS